MTSSEEAPPPDPLDWHPAYRDNRIGPLLDWLEGRNKSADPDRFHIPLVHRPKFVDAGAPIEAETIHMHTLTRYQVQGLAPYVGRPFVYRWWVATDELGRSIASESHAHYVDHLSYYMQAEEAWRR